MRAGALDCLPGGTTTERRVNATVVAIMQHALYSGGMFIDFGTYGEFDPFIFTIPAYEDEDGDPQQPSIVLQLTGHNAGPQLPHSRISLSLAEAESLVAQLTTAVENGKAGKFTRIGYEVARKPLDENTIE